MLVLSATHGNFSRIDLINSLYDSKNWSDKMGVKEFSQHIGITSDTVRYYTRIGFLNPRKSLNNGYRQFGQEDLERMVFILRSRQLGLTVSDIRKIFEEVGKGGTPCPLVRELLDKRLRQIDIEFQKTKELRQRMENARSEWKSKPDQPPSSGHICSLIDEIDLLDDKYRNH